MLVFSVWDEAKLKLSPTEVVAILLPVYCGEVMHTYDESRIHMSPKSRRPEEEQEIDLVVLRHGVPRQLPTILLSSLMLGAGAYLSCPQSRVYELRTSQPSNDTQRQKRTGPLNSLSRAAPLSDGMFSQVLGSSLVLGKVIKQVCTSITVQEPKRTRLVQALQGDFAQVRTPEAARRLADLSSRVLANWDRSHAIEGLHHVWAGFQTQLFQLQQQLKPANTQKREVLITRQASIQSNLIQYKGSSYVSRT